LISDGITKSASLANVSTGRKKTDNNVNNFFISVIFGFLFGKDAKVKKYFKNTIPIYQQQHATAKNILLLSIKN
jgi:hypothetical protein